MFLLLIHQAPGAQFKTQHDLPMITAFGDGVEWAHSHKRRG